MNAPLPPDVVKKVKVKPRLRGVSHVFGFVAALVFLWPMAAAPQEGARYVAGLVYAASLALMLGLSGLYHRPFWSSQMRARLRRFDHIGIYALIAGSYTPLAVLVDRPTLRTELAAMWGAALAGAVFAVAWSHAPRGLRTGVYIGISFIAFPVIQALPAFIGPEATWALLAGGVLYIVGGIVYAFRWPNPDPRFFGYHELFHLFVLAAGGIHALVILQAQWAVNDVFR